MDEASQRVYKLKKRKVSLLVILASAATGLIAALLTDSLKLLTEHYGHVFREKFMAYPVLIFVLPLTGLSIVWILRKFLFRNKKNQGITEIFNNLTKKGALPAYKIPSHYINGLVTVAFGGSTGIEVSTVVSTAAVGSVASNKSKLLRKYKNILTCAGIAAGVTALFNAPVAGILFALEVFRRKFEWTYFLSLTVAVLVSFFVNYLIGTVPVFDFSIGTWHGYAFPYFLLLGVLAALLSVYLTKSVIYFKRLSASLPSEWMRVLGGAMVISTAIFFVPALYGEGYFAVTDLIAGKEVIGFTFFLSLLAVLLLKPLVTAITLGAGGDGGVFAPSLFLGAFLGYFLAVLLNHYFKLAVIPVNFMVIGMAAMLSGSIHAPFTAIFLVCAMVGNYQLFVPVMVVSLISRVVAYWMVPYSVYTYGQRSSG